METSLTIGITLFGVFIAIFLPLFIHLLSTINKMRYEIKEIMMKIESRPIAPTIPSSHLFFAALAREARFWGKLFIQRSDKITISHAIASKYIDKGETVIVDSGTTIDQIPYILGEKYKDVKIYTNNLLAAIAAVPPVEGFQCFLLPGLIDPIYGATYNIGDIEGPLKSENVKSAHKIILAATALSFDEGPMVSVQDFSNLKYKRQLVENALSDPNKHKLIIAADWTKFIIIRELEVSNDLNPVLESSVWHAVRAMKTFCLVTTKPADVTQTKKANVARKVINEFEKNMNKKNGMGVCFAKLD